MRNLEELLNLNNERENYSKNRPLWLVEKAYAQCQLEREKRNEKTVLPLPNIT